MHAIVLIGQMQLQKVFHNLVFIRCERINAISAIVLLTHYVQSSPATAIFACTGTVILEFHYAGEAREIFRTPSFWKQKRRAARFATSSSLFSTYLVVISSDFNTDFCVAHTAVRRW